MFWVATSLLLVSIPDRLNREGHACLVWSDEPMIAAGAANFLNAMLWDARPCGLAATVYLHVSLLSHGMTLA